MVRLSATPANVHKISILMTLHKSGKSPIVTSKRISIEDLPQSAEIEYFDLLTDLLVATFNENLTNLETKARRASKETSRLMTATKK